MLQFLRAVSDWRRAVGNLIRLILNLPVIGGLVRSATRILVGALAIPLFRLFRKRVLGLDKLDPELEKDIEQWFRASLLLLVATRNLEESLFGWVPLKLADEGGWLTVGLRLLLAVGIVESMPDQDFFAIIHPGPKKFRFVPGRSKWSQFREQIRPFLKGALCQHINRSSPVLAIMAAIFNGWVGWVCYGLAITQYLIIGLVTSRDRAIDVLAAFDQRIEERREQLIREFHLKEGGTRHPRPTEHPMGMVPAVSEARDDLGDVPLPARFMDRIETEPAES